MRRFATLIATTALGMSGLVFIPAHATGPANGDYVCTTGALATNETTNLYTITGGAVAMHSSGKCAGDVLIRAGVTSISFEAFFQATALTSITIPASVTSIAIFAFLGTTALTTVNFDSGSQLTNVEPLTFSGATALTSISIPASVTSIGFGAFLDATRLTTVIFESGSELTTIEHQAFGNTSLTSIIIPIGVTTIGDVAFDNAHALTSIYFLGNAPTTVGITPFLRVASGAKAYIKFGDSSFGAAGADWNGLEVEILAQDGTYACATGFITTETMNVYTITTGVISRHNSGRCAGAAVIPSGVTTIGEYAFQYADALSSITIPEGVTHIGGAAFSGATLLSSIRLPSSITHIESYAFYGTTNLTSINIPSGVTNLGSSAFASASALTRITIPASIDRISPYLFEGATALTSITISPSVKSIDGYAFKDTTALTSITIPASVRIISSGAFINARALRSIYFLGNAPATVGDTAFTGIGLAPKAFIKLGATGFSKAGSNWKGLTVAVLDQKAISKVKPKVTGTAKVRKTLSANKGTWIGSPTPTYSYQWYSCRKAVTAVSTTVPSSCKKISRATKSTFKLAAAQKGKFVTVLVTGVSKRTSKTSWLAKSTVKVK